MKSKKHLIFYAIFSTVLSILLIFLTLTQIGEVDIDGTDFSLFFEIPAIFLIVLYYIFSNAVCWFLNTHKSVVFFTALPIMIGLLCFSVSTANYIFFLNDVKPTDFVYQDNTPDEISLVETLKYDFNKSKEENLQNMSLVFEKNQMDFLDKVSYTPYNSKTPESHQGKNYFSSSIVYNCYRVKYGSNNKSLISRDFDIEYVENCANIESRFEWVPSVALEELDDYAIDSNKKYIDIVYEKYFFTDQYSYVDINFITNDIESVFGKIIKEDEFKSSLETFLTSPASYSGSARVFETENNCSIILALSDAGNIYIYGTALLELKEGVNEQNFIIVNPPVIQETNYY